MNRCLAAFLALLFASLTVSSACLAEPSGQANRLLRHDDLNLWSPAMAVIDSSATPTTPNNRR
jgi:hypothetical protein